MARALLEALRRRDVLADHVRTISDAEALARDGSYDVLVLDRRLPDGEGLNLVASLRRSRHSVPILVLTALGSVDHRVDGLDAGADDYLAKPFEPKELVLRLQAILRRAVGPLGLATESIVFGDFAFAGKYGELRKRGDWNDDRELTYQGLRKEILDYEVKLKKGGIKLSEAKTLALEMADKRDEMVGMLSSRTELDNNTCEGQAEAARFNCMFADCLVYEETGEKYFPEGLEDYIVSSDDPVAVIGATEFYYLLTGTENLDDSL